MFTPRNNNVVKRQIPSADPFTTPQKISQIKDDHSTAGTLNSPLSSGSPPVYLFGLTSPWETTSGKQQQSQFSTQITDRYIPSRKLFSQKSLSLHSMEIEHEEDNIEEAENIISGQQWNIQAQNKKDYHQYLSNLYCEDSKNLKTPGSFSNKNFLRYSNASLESQDPNHFQKTYKGYMPLTHSPTQPNTFRHIETTPYKILDAPNLQDDYYLNLLEWSESCNQIAIGLGERVYTWDADKQYVRKLAEFDTLVTSVSWVKNAPLLSVGSSNGYVQIFDLVKRAKIREYKYHDNRVSCLSWKNQNVFSSGSKDHNIVHADIRQSHFWFSTSYGHKQQVCGLKWSQDQQKLCSGGNDNKLFIWDRNNFTNPIIKYNDHKAAVKALAWSPHQHGLLISGGGTADRTIRFRNTINGQTSKIIETGSQVCNLLFSKTENQFVSTHGYSQNEIALWKYPKIKKMFSLKNHHSSRVLYLTMSPDGETVVTGAGDQTLRFWKMFPKSSSKNQQGNPGKSMLQIKHVSIR